MIDLTNKIRTIDDLCYVLRFLEQGNFSTAEKFDFLNEQIYPLCLVVAEPLPDYYRVLGFSGERISMRTDKILKCLYAKHSTDTTFEKIEKFSEAIKNPLLAIKDSKGAGVVLNLRNDNNNYLWMPLLRQQDIKDQNILLFDNDTDLVTSLFGDKNPDYPDKNQIYPIVFHKILEASTKKSGTHFISLNMDLKELLKLAAPDEKEFKKHQYKKLNRQAQQFLGLDAFFKIGLPSKNNRSLTSQLKKIKQNKEIAAQKISSEIHQSILLKNGTFQLPANTYKSMDFSQLEMANFNFEGCTFINCKFPNADLRGCNFQKCTFKICDLTNANLQHSILRDVKIENSILNGTNFSRANVENLEQKNNTMNETILTHLYPECNAFNNEDSLPNYLKQLDYLKTIVDSIQQQNTREMMEKDFLNYLQLELQKLQDLEDKRRQDELNKISEDLRSEAKIFFNTENIPEIPSDSSANNPNIKHKMKENPKVVIPENYNPTEPNPINEAELIEEMRIRSLVPNLIKQRLHQIDEEDRKLREQKNSSVDICSIPYLTIEEVKSKEEEERKKGLKSKQNDKGSSHER